MMTPALFIFLKIVFPVQGVLGFHKNQNFSSSFMKNMIEISIDLTVLDCMEF